MTSDEYMERLEDEVERARRAHEDARVAENCAMPKDEALAYVRSLQETAESSGLKRCLYGEAMVFWPYRYALVPGHIYSRAGVEEARISGCCEYHFDEMFSDEDEDDDSRFPVTFSRQVRELPDL